ncbi:MAG: response regulator, partial [Fimbriimonadaceae bacterium]|nr:response regulator [Fimbriimonadaceae bacterium]
MRILVVEDDEVIASQIGRALQKEGHRTRIEHDGESGLDAALEHPYGLILLDWMMPGLSGIEVCRRLRAAGLSTPILMLTARDEVESRVEGLDCGADDYLVKPFALAELMARVRALGRR